MGALVVARLVNFVMKSLTLINIFIHVWVDSQIVLYCFRRLLEFVAHRAYHLISSASCTTAPQVKIQQIS